MVEESGGFCDLCDRVGVEPTVKFVATAVELETVKEGKRVKELKIAYDEREKDGQKVEYPRWGIVIQASKNFFAYLAAYHENQGDIRDLGWEIIRTGSSTDTKYAHFPLTASLPDLSGLEVPSVEDILEGMGSDEHYAQTQDIKAGSQPTYGDDAKPSVDTGTVPSGDRDSEFAKIKAELESDKTKVEAY